MEYIKEVEELKSSLAKKAVELDKMTSTCNKEYRSLERQVSFLMAVIKTIEGDTIPMKQW